VRARNRWLLSQKFSSTVIPLPATEVVGVLLNGDVDLAEQGRLGPAQRNELAQLVQQPLAAVGRIGRPCPLDHVRRSVDPEPGDTHPQPEGHDPPQLGADPRVRQAQVGLVPLEDVAVELLRPLVPRPDAVLDGGEDRFDVGLVRLVGADVVVAVGRARVAARILEPAVLDRGVLRDEVDDDADAELVGAFSSSAKSARSPKRASTVRRSVR
jgi:hypothetical protein